MIIEILVILISFFLLGFGFGYKCGADMRGEKE